MIPASFFLSQVDTSWFSRGVSSAQAVVRRGSRFSHAGIAVGGGYIVHAHPKIGVVRERFTDRYGDRDVLWSDAPIQRYVTETFAAEQDIRQRVVEAALQLVGRPYSWLSYLSIAATEWSLPGRDRLRQMVRDRREYMCGATVDEAYAMAGVHLFNGRTPHDVTPADLAFYDELWMRERVVNLEGQVEALELNRVDMETRMLAIEDKIA